MLNEQLVEITLHLNQILFADRRLQRYWCMVGFSYCFASVHHKNHCKPSTLFHLYNNKVAFTSAT